MMEKISWKSMYLKLVLICLICSKTSSKISSASETAASKRVGSTDEKYHRLPNENHLPHLELDDATAVFLSEESVGIERNVSIEKVAWSMFSDTPWIAAFKSHNSTDEDEGSRIVLTPLLSEMHVNGTKTPFICSNITLNEKEFQLSSKNLYTRLMLRISNLTHSSKTITVCKPVVEDEIVVEYPPACSFIITSFIYSTFSLLCAWACIISVPKFVVLFLASNVFTYFLICLILTGSLSDVLVYFVPIHINFMFFLITGWVTILSCKVVFEVVKTHGILRVSNGEIVGNSVYMFHVTVAISCLFPLLTGLGSKSYIVHTSDNSLESVYFQMMAQYTLSVILVLVLVMLVDVIFTNQRKKMQDSGVRHTRHYLMYFCYHLFALVSWVYGFVAVTVPDYPHFWRLYFFVAMALPIFFLKDVIMTAKVRLSFLVERSGNPVEIYRIRVQHV